VATIPTAKLLCLSSPYARTGVLYDTYRQHYGKDGDVLVWQADTRTMNPTIPQAFITRETERDPQAARAEWGAEFREDLESAFPLEVIEACVISGRQHLPPASEVHYQAFVDPSGGRSDAFTLAVGHRHREGTIIIDLVKGWNAPFSPEAVVREACEWLRMYRVQRVTGDRYAGEWPREQFAKHGVLYEECEQPKSELYLALLPGMVSRQVELLDMPELVQQLTRLERRKTKVGRETVDHPTGGHDDLANAVAGVVHVLGETLDVRVDLPDFSELRTASRWNL
jgi:hypothetical protein